jgi:hypothetical protein
MNSMKLHGAVNTVGNRLAMARRAALPLALLLALPGGAFAFELDYRIGASVVHSDNINLSESAPDSETVISPEFEFTAEQIGSAIELNARGALQYLDYQSGEYQSEFRGEFAGQLHWKMIPQRLDFVVEDYLSQQPIDITSGATPNNRQQVNVLTFGPSLFLRFGEAMRGQLDARYTDTYAEETQDFNGKRYNLGAHLFRQFTPLSSISFNAESTQVEYDDMLLDADYRRYDGYVGYTRESKRLNLDLVGGYTRIEPENGDPDLDGPLFRGRLDWSISARSSLNARLAYQFSDTALDAVLYNTDADGPIIRALGALNPLVGADIYKLRRAQAGYGYSGPRLGVQVQSYHERVSYPDANIFDHEGSGIGVGGSYRLQPLLALDFSASFAKRDFVDIDRGDDDVILSIGLTRQFSRHWSASARVQRRDRDSDAAGQSFKENLATLNISYRR